MKISLTDASLLDRVATALRLTRHVGLLVVDCGQCPEGRRRPRQWPSWANVQGIKDLGLNYFHLEALPPKALENFTAVEGLALQKDELMTLPEDLLKPLNSSLMLLDLHGNPKLKEEDLPLGCEQKGGKVWCDL